MIPGPPHGAPHASFRFADRIHFMQCGMPCSRLEAPFPSTPSSHVQPRFAVFAREPVAIWNNPMLPVARGIDFIQNVESAPALQLPSNNNHTSGNADSVYYHGPFLRRDAPTDSTSCSHQEKGSPARDLLFKTLASEVAGV